MKKKSKTTALILSIFLGEFGIDQFYLGHTGRGFIKLFTMGLFGIFWIIDIVKIFNGSMRDKNGNELV